MLECRSVQDAREYRDLILATFGSTLSVAGILLALLGFLLARSDSMKANDYTGESELTPFRILVGLIGLLICLASVSAVLALAWLFTFGGFAYPLWLPALLITALPFVAVITIKLRW